MHVMGSASKRRERRPADAIPRHRAGGSTPSPYTFEGAIAGLGDFAAAINRTRGWKGVVAKLLVIGLFIIPILWNVLRMGADLFGT